MHSTSGLQDIHNKVFSKLISSTYFRWYVDNNERYSLANLILFRQHHCKPFDLLIVRLNLIRIKSGNCSERVEGLIVQLAVYPVAILHNTSLLYRTRVWASFVIELLGTLLTVSICSFLVKLHTDMSSPMSEAFFSLFKQEWCNTM